MNYNKARDVLEITNDMSLDNIRKQYKLKALLYHPDKNKSEDAKSQFQEISDAYRYLLKHNEHNEDDEKVLSNMDYKYYLFMFLKNFTVHH